MIKLTLILLSLPLFINAQDPPCGWSLSGDTIRYNDCAGKIVQINKTGLFTLKTDTKDSLDIIRAAMLLKSSQSGLVDSSGALRTSINLKQDVSGNTGGWTTLRVAGSNYTNATTSLTDVTGLVSSTLSTATLYEFEANLYCNSSSTAGMQIAVQQTGTGSGQIGVWTGTATSGAATSLAIGSNVLNTAGAACVLVNGNGSIQIRGYIKTGSSGSPTILLRALKTTSGTATVYIGSVFRYRVAQ